MGGLEGVLDDNESVLGERVALIWMVGLILLSLLAILL